MAASAQTVFIVDDDEAVCDSLSMLVRSVGLEAAAFPSAADFLDGYALGSGGCLVLDVRMRGMSGLDLQDQLQELDPDLPIIFITGHGDVPMAVRAMKKGAVDFILKPFQDQDLLDRIQDALALDRRQRQEHEHRVELESRLTTLTPREREVLELVVEGHANKVVASRLDLSQRTVEIHRAHVMQKMGADSLAHLVRMTLRLDD